MIGDTKDEAFNKYLVKMGLADEKVEEDQIDTLNTTNKENKKDLVGIEKQYSITIDDIIFAVNDGQTYIYIKADDNIIFKSEFNESLLFLNADDKINLNVLIDGDTENSPIINILDVYGISKNSEN